MCAKLSVFRPSDWVDIERLLFIKAAGKASVYTQSIIRITWAISCIKGVDSWSPTKLTNATHQELRCGTESAQDKVKRSLGALDRILASNPVNFDMSSYKSVAEKCKKCGAPLKITFKQTRSADEGMTMIQLPCAECTK